MADKNMEQVMEKAQVLIEALPYIQRFNRKIIVVKYGGSAMVDEQLKKQVIQDVTLLKLVGFKPIIVHGGGKEISKWVGKVGMELHCFVGNQWKKSFDTPAARVVCRLTGSIFAVGCLDADGKQLAEEMQNLYRQMPRECITTTGMMRRVPFTLSCGAAGLEDVSAKNWQALYELCDARLREAQNAGGDQMRAE